LRSYFKNVKVYRSIGEYEAIPYAVVTVGTFDGVHLGHRKIIDRVIEAASEENGESVLITFEPHPRSVLYADSWNLKLITAAAAVETCDLEPGSLLNFSGGKYTLYKSQLDPKPSKYANRITLKDSFAQSVNPVFGKLGANRLGKDVIEDYAEAFGFNREIDFELPLRPSRIELSDKAFALAEVASGYNRTTRISPLHGAIMAAAVVNHGRWVEPTVVDWIVNDAGQTVYQNQTVYRDQAIDLETARVLRRLMQATVQSGTAHRAFQKHHGDKVLSRLEIGGKTGSMGDGSAEMFYDWFVGYARELHGTEQVVFAVVVAHEDYIGTRASAYAAMAIKEYFKGHVAQIEDSPTPKS
jgi:cytidyltransferase-like protein